MTAPAFPASDAAADVAVVDDDVLFAETLTGNLTASGFAARAYASGADFFAALDAGAAPDLVLLDWKMPELSGLDVLRRLRRDRPDLPVIFLTVLSDQMFEEAALLGGAVDFVEKSRSFAILQRRIQLILDRAPAAPETAPESLKTGELELDLAGRRARWRGRMPNLTLGEFEMVRLLAERAGRDVSYRDLYDQVRGAGFRAGDGDDGYRANVRASIKRIREKFREIDAEFDQIANYPGFGYAWRSESA